MFPKSVYTSYLGRNPYEFKRQTLTLKIICLPRPPSSDIIAQVSPSFTAQPETCSNGHLVWDGAPNLYILDPAGIWTIGR